MAATEEGDRSGKLDELLVIHAAWLHRCVSRRSGWLARLESVDDLVQEVTVRALDSSASFEYRGDGPLRAWLGLIVDQTLADRGRYWSAGRRNAGPILRITAVGAPSTIADAARGIVPESDGPGPKTWAERRDQHAFAIRAITALLPRDQMILDRVREGASDPELAEELGCEPESAARARQRAIERFRRAYELLVRATEQ